MNQSKKPLGLILGLLAVVAVALFLFRGCSGNPLVPNTGGQTGNQPGGQQGKLGRVFAASAVDQNGCPADRASQFSSDQTIYAGFERSSIPRGTSVFARLSREGDALEDTREITADRDLTACVWFAFEPSSRSGGFEPGRYTVEMFVNGNAAGSVNLTVGGQGSSGSGGSTGGARLSDLTLTDRVDSKGCPAGDRRSEFASDEPVYVAYGRSEIPAGTQMYAKLISGQRAVETTDPITADRDLTGCVWFVFDTASTGGLPPGSYQVQVFVNDSRADTALFTVR